MSKRRWCALLALSMSGLVGCTMKPLDSFTLEVDLPADFELKTAANYGPATGETCTLPRRRGKRPERKVFFTDYKPVASRVSYELPLGKKVEGCPLVLRSVELGFTAKWGTRSTDVGGDIGDISILDRLETDTRWMPDSGVQELRGECEWRFRTVGPFHGIRKILKCHSLSGTGQVQRTRAGGFAQRDHLSGKTLRMVLNLSEVERPAVDDNWTAVPGGWKRCRGEGFEDTYAFCNGDNTHFKPITMPDGRVCDVYPSCN
ncbi:hypothetical protein JYG38_08635 [Pseudomonas rhodesiae]|uniref:hypothetical protein n=1 Tax=Pseudomonas rhodesiae TaxID=76760 RepID=UPI001BCC8961|nr:hypothetical protein [Pseudomonas rhodesiae]QVN03505.1 hypothetical protein JYG38_08635 [Pseudomonas rhodesiae]